MKEPIRVTFLMLALVAWILIVTALFSACPRPTPGPGEHQTPITCATNAVQACAPGALPAVNECLSGTGDVTACLLGLIKPVGCITYEVVACLVRHEGSAAEHAYQANPGDTRDHWRAQRAREFLTKTGARFDDERRIE